MEEEKKKKEGKGIRVADRRTFDASGRRRAPDPAESPPGEERKGEETPSSPTAEEASKGPPPPVSFEFFIQNLYLAALVNLGDIEDPLTRKQSANLDAARQTIDLLGILMEKTRGNLEPKEKSHLEDVLYDLRMRFAKKVPAP